MDFSVKISRVTYCCRVLETSRFWTWLSRWRLGPTSASPRNYHRARIATFNVDRHKEAAGMKWSNKMAVKNTQTTQQTCLTKLVWRKGFCFFKEIVSKMVESDNRCAIYTQALCLLFEKKTPEPFRSTIFSNTFFFLIVSFTCCRTSRFNRYTVDLLAYHHQGMVRVTIAEISINTSFRISSYAKEATRLFNRNYVIYVRNEQFCD